MYLAIQIVLVITSVLMSLFVLLHKGKGGGLSSLFGGGMQSNLSGSTIVEKNDYVTIITAILWLRRRCWACSRPSLVGVPGLASR